jgi:membrane-bound serine protease (ClpP class)
MVFVPVGVGVLLGIAQGDFTKLGVGLLLVIPAVELWEISRSTECVDHRPTLGREGLVGRRGEVVQDCAPRGTVKIQGELWRAVAERDHLAAGQGAVVLAVNGLTLTVAPGAESRNEE